MNSYYGMMVNGAYIRTQLLDNDNNITDENDMYAKYEFHNSGEVSWKGGIIFHILNLLQQKTGMEKRYFYSLCIHHFFLSFS